MFHRSFRWHAAPWLVALLALSSVGAWGGERPEFLLFPDVVATHRDGLAGDSDLQRDQAEAALDLLVTGSRGGFSFLGEFFGSRHEKEVARLHAGWRMADTAVLSIGKFHNLQGYWNTQFHHGAFLHSSISRPGIIEDDGLLPTHYVGIQLEGDVPLSDASSIGYSVGAGKSALLRDGMLESPDLVGPQRDGKQTIGARLTYSPFEGAPTQAGLFFAVTRIPVENSELDEIRQSVGGVYGNWEHADWRLIGELYLFRNRLAGSGERRNSTLHNGYLQGEYRFSDKWLAFGRIENTGNGGKAMLTLQEFPEFTRKRAMAGLRFDLPHKQALKVEAGRIRRLDDAFSQVQLQWSAVFP